MFSQAARLSLVPRPSLPVQDDALDLSALLIGPVVELSGPASSGKSSLAFHRCLTALREGQAVAWIDPGLGFCPMGAAEAGESLDRLLVVRVPTGVEVMRAADMVLSCPGAVAVLVAALPARFRPAEAALLRLQRLAERSGSLLIFLDENPSPSASLGSPIGLRLRVHRAEGIHWSSRLEIVRNKGGPCAPLAAELLHGPNRLRLHSTL